MIERRYCGTLEGTPHWSTCRPYMLKEIDRLTAQLDASRALLAERDDVLSARFNENKELYMHWQQALTETTTLRTKLAECEKEVERLKEVQGICEICEVEAIKHADKVRKQTELEIIDCIIQHGWGMHTIDHLRNRYGLEG